MSAEQWWIHFEPDVGAANCEWFAAAQFFGARGWQVSRLGHRAVGPGGEWFEISSPARDLVGARPTRMTGSASWLRQVSARAHSEVHWLAGRSGIELEIVESLSGALWSEHRMAS